MSVSFLHITIIVRKGNKKDIMPVAKHIISFLFKSLA